MYHKFFFISLLIVSLSSCNFYSNDFKLLPADKMQEVLVDIHIEEAAAQHKFDHPDSVKIHMHEAYLYIFEKHEIEAADFFNSFEYYIYNKIDELDELYQYVIQELSLKDAELSARKLKVDEEIEDDIEIED
ncbi:MAG: DUF4296 domain-containing protein [Chitinophagaceae bacterium]|nr:MAG: DUF4296 domain-containing protein [Chitinophagaceae bacterium]